MPGPVGTPAPSRPGLLRGPARCAGREETVLANPAHAHPAASAARPTTAAAGYAAAVAAGALWGTTGPLSTALYATGAELTSVGFWRIAVAAAGLAALAVVRPALRRVDRTALLLVGGLGGALVALFEIAYQFGIAGTGVAGAAALLYTAPVLVALLAGPLLGEQVTARRLLLAVAVMAGAALTVLGGTGVEEVFPDRVRGLVAGVIGGLLAALAYAGTTLVARFAVPRYGALRVLALEMMGGTLLLAVILPLAGRPPALPGGPGAWLYVLLLALGAVLGANALFFAALKRIAAAPASVAATVEPVVAAGLGVVLLGQVLAPAGWLGLSLVVAAVATGYLLEARAGAG
ncbi:MAG: EamA family transporter [Gemmatimonadota bacterium]|nr:EamA family transporter [Gemmatimonadota bacterium]